MDVVASGLLAALAALALLPTSGWVVGTPVGPQLKRAADISRGPVLRARSLIDGASFGQDALKTIRQKLRCTGWRSTFARGIGPSARAKPIQFEGSGVGGQKPRCPASNVATN
jgi:hypothetical protein